MYIKGINAYISTEGDLADNITSYSENDNDLITVITLNFEDEVLYILPETGGSGVYVYTIGGILLMLAGSLLLYKNKNNKK